MKQRMCIGSPPTSTVSHLPRYEHRGDGSELFRGSNRGGLFLFLTFFGNFLYKPRWSAVQFILV